MTSSAPSPWEQIVAAGLWREGTPLRLSLGAGGVRHEGFLNFDFPPPAGAPEIADVYGDLLALHFPVEAADEVRFGPGAARLARADAVDMLARAHTWLRVGAPLKVHLGAFPAIA